MKRVRHYVIGSSSSSCGGAWASATGRGGGAGSRPRLRSISSAVRLLVTMAVTLRLPPQGHCQTSTAQTFAWSEAQSSLSLFGFTARVPVAGAGGGCAGEAGVGITVARAAA